MPDHKRQKLFNIRDKFERKYIEVKNLLNMIDIFQNDVKGNDDNQLENFYKIIN